jgi:hypothetical protein
MLRGLATATILTVAGATLSLSDEGVNGDGAPQITFGRSTTQKAVLSVSCEGDWSATGDGSASPSPSAPASTGAARTSTTPFFHAPPSTPFISEQSAGYRMVSLRDMSETSGASDCPAGSVLLRPVPYGEYFTMPNGDSYACQHVGFGHPHGNAVTFSAARFSSTGAYTQQSLFTLTSTWPYAAAIASLDKDSSGNTVTWDNSDVGGSASEVFSLSAGAEVEAARARIMTKACGMYKICSW